MLKFCLDCVNNVCVECVKLLYETEVRQWTDFLPQNVTFKNAYRVRKMNEDDELQVPVPHSFTFMPRSGRRCLLC